MMIDFHTHAFNPKIAEKAISHLESVCGEKAMTGGTPDELIGKMDEWGVDKSVVLNIATKPSQQTVVNNWAAKFQRETDRIICFGSVHPEAPDVLSEIERVKSLGMKGIKFHPDYQHFMVDDPKYDAMYDCIEQAGLYVVFHAGWDFVSPELIHCPPARSAKLIKRHPKLKVILAHLGGNKQWDDVKELIAGIDGEVYLDTSFTAECPGGLMTEIIRKHGTERILFGSDSPWESAAAMAEKLLRLDITDDDRDRIYGLNAQRLLGLKINCV